MIITAIKNIPYTSDKYFMEKSLSENLSSSFNQEDEKDCIIIFSEQVKYFYNIQN